MKASCLPIKTASGSMWWKCRASVDEGTSVLIEAQVGADFHAETTLLAVAELFRQHGLPQAVRLDRDGRLVSSPSGSDFPSALLRFCHCLGVAVQVCDPHHPQQNGFVERYHRTYQEECLAVHRPGTLEQVREITVEFAQHYNSERPLKAAQLRQSSATGRVPDLAGAAHRARPGGPGPLAPGQRWPASRAPGAQRRHSAPRVSRATTWGVPWLASTLHCTCRPPNAPGWSSGASR
jgi:hypothetical protein